MRNVKKYCLPKKAGAVICGCAFMIPAVFVIVQVFFKNNNFGMNKLAAILVSAGFCLIGWLIYYAIYGQTASIFKKRVRYLQSIGAGGLIEEDFNRAVGLFNNNLKAGKQFLFGRKSGMIVMYSEINYIYRNEHRTDYTSGARSSFRYNIKINCGGKAYDLCTISRADVISADWFRFSNFLVLKNPNIGVSQIITQSHSVVDDTSSGDD